MADVLLVVLFGLELQAVQYEDPEPTWIMMFLVPFDNAGAALHNAAHAFVLRALQLMAAPRDVAPRKFLPVEAIFSQHMRKLEPRMTPAQAARDVSFGYTCDWVGMCATLAAAWARLQRAPPFHARGGVDAATADAATEEEALQTSLMRATDASKLRTCALPACQTREQHERHFKLCAACQTVAYCCKAHQKEDWPHHKAACKAACTAARAAADGDAV